MMHPPCVNLHEEWLAKNALDRTTDFKVEGRIIVTIKYALYLVFLAKEEKLSKMWSAESRRI